MFQIFYILYFRFNAGSYYRPNKRNHRAIVPRTCIFYQLARNIFGRFSILNAWWSYCEIFAPNQKVCWCQCMQWRFLFMARVELASWPKMFEHIGAFRPSFFFNRRLGWFYLWSFRFSYQNRILRRELVRIWILRVLSVYGIFPYP